MIASFADVSSADGAAYAAEPHAAATTAAQSAWRTRERCNDVIRTLPIARDQSRASIDDEAGLWIARLDDSVEKPVGFVDILKRPDADAEQRPAAKIDLTDLGRTEALQSDFHPVGIHV